MQGGLSFLQVDEMTGEKAKALSHSERTKLGEGGVVTSSGEFISAIQMDEMLSVDAQSSSTLCAQAIRPDPTPPHTPPPTAVVDKIVGPALNIITKSTVEDVRPRARSCPRRSPPDESSPRARNAGSQAGHLQFGRAAGE